MIKSRNTSFIFIIYITSLLIILIFSGCKDLLNNSEPDNTVKWEYGTETTYTIKSGSESFTDSLTGYKFVFPAGSTGNLTVILIKKGPPINIDAKMFGLTYTGKDSFKIIMPHTKGALDFLYEFKAQTKGAIDWVKDVNRWWGVEIMETTDTEVIFTIVPNQTKVTKGTDDIPQTQPLNSYAFGRIPESVSNEERIALIKQGINEMVQHFADTYLSGSTRQRVLNNHKLINLEIRDVSEDEGSAVDVSQGIFSTTAIFWFSLTKVMSLPVFAHEAGHYINYLLLGNDLYDQENDRFGYDMHVAFKTHKKGRNQGLKEDTPYFLESLLSNKTQIEKLDGTDLGLWKRWIRDPQDPNELKTPIYQPSDRDFPGVEGFAAMMLTALTATNDKCYNFMAIEQNTADARRFETRIPVLGVPPDEVVSGVLLKFPKNINEMMNHIFNYLQDYRKSDVPKFLARIEPLGWSYHGKAVIVDEYGKPIPKAQILPVIQTGQSTRDYWTDYSIQADDKGNCYVPRLYPGQSILRVFYNNGADSADFPCSIDYTKPTHETIDLGELKIEIKELKINPENLTGEPDKEYQWTAEYPEPPLNSKYIWNFGDGTGDVVVTASKYVKHTYKNSGDFDITLKLYDNSSNTLIKEAKAKAKINLSQSVTRNFRKHPLMITSNDRPVTINGSWKLSGTITRENLTNDTLNVYYDLRKNVASRFEFTMEPYIDTTCQETKYDFDSSYKKYYYMPLEPKFKVDKNDNTIQMTIKNPSANSIIIDFTFSKYDQKIYIDPQIVIYMKIEYYSKQGKLLKTEKQYDNESGIYLNFSIGGVD